MAIQLLPIIAAFGSASRFGTILAGLLSVFSSIFAWFLNFFTRKVALNWAIVSFIIGIAVTAFLAIEALALGIGMFVPSEYGVALSLIVPSNATKCMSAIIACKTVRWFFIWQSWAIEMGTR